MYDLIGALGGLTIICIAIVPIALAIFIFSKT